MFFCNSPLTGLFCVAGIFYESRYLGAAAMVGAVVATGTAYLFAFEAGSVASGLLGYNGVLAAISLAVFSFGGGDDGDAAADWQLHEQIWVGIVFVAVLAPVLTIAIGRVTVASFSLAPFTLPFQVAVWLWLLAMQQAAYFPVNGNILQPGLNSYPTSFPNVSWVDYAASDVPDALFKGVGQVFLMPNLVTGVLFVVGILFCTPIGAAMTLLGSGIGLATALGLGLPPADIAQGLYSFNAVLTVQAVGGFFFVLTGGRALVLSLFAGMVSTVTTAALSAFLGPLGLPGLTFPFVVTTWAFVLLAGQSPGLIAVDLASLTVPEDHRRRYRLAQLVLSQFHSVRELASLLPPTTKPEEIAHVENNLLPTLLCHFAASGDIGNLRQLLSAGAPATAADYDGRQAVHLAAAVGHVPVLKLLLPRRRARLTQLSSGAGSSEAGGGATQVDVNALDNFGDHPLDDAVRVDGRLEAVQVLLQAGGKLSNAPDIVAERSARVCMAAATGNLAVLRRYHAAGGAAALSSGNDPDGRTPLMVAASEGRAEVVAYLLGLGVDPAAKDVRGRTAWDAATHAGHNHVATILAKALADGPASIPSIDAPPDPAPAAPVISPELNIRVLVPAESRRKTGVVEVEQKQHARLGRRWWWWWWWWWCWRRDEWEEKWGM